MQFQEQWNFNEQDISQKQSKSLHSKQFKLKISCKGTPKFNSKDLSQSMIRSNRSNLSTSRLQKSIDKHINHRNEKIKELKEIQENKFKENYTFKPAINHKGNPRKLDDFLNSQSKHLKKVEEKSQRMKTMMELQERKNATFSPQINRKIPTKNKGMQPTFQRLYNVSNKQNCEIKEDKKRNIPKITTKAARLTRNKPIQQLLYDDALQRMNKSLITLQSEDNFQTKNRNIENNKFVAQKLLKEYQISFEKHNIGNNQILSEKQFLKIMADLGYSKEKERSELQKKMVYQAYEMLQNHRLTPSNLCIFLLAINGIYNVDLSSQNQQKGKQTLMILEEQGKKIHKYFDILYRNKLHYECEKKSPIKNEQQNSYSPRINPGSKTMVDKHRGKMIQKVNNIFQNLNMQIQSQRMTHEDLLIIHNIGNNFERQKQREQNNNKIDKECTFQPNSARGLDKSKISQKVGEEKWEKLYNYGKMKNIQRNKMNTINLDKSQEKIETTTERGYETNRSHKSPKKIKNVKDFQKTLARMQLGRNIRTDKDEVLQRGQKLIKNGKSIKIGKKPENGKNKQPFLVVDINHNNTLKHINFYEGDEKRIEQIIQQFCDECGYDEGSFESLVKQVKTIIC